MIIVRIIAVSFSCEEGSYFVYNSDTYSAMQGITVCQSQDVSDANIVLI